MYDSSLVFSFFSFQLSLSFMKMNHISETHKNKVSHFISSRMHKRLDYGGGERRGLGGGGARRFRSCGGAAERTWSKRLSSLYLAAQNGHPQFSRILLFKYIPSVPNCWSLVKTNKSSVSGFDQSILHEVINRASDRGITPLHVAALKGHMLTVQVLLDLGAFVAQVIVEDGVRQLKTILAHHLRYLYNLRT
ncbi:hypothetical protein IGI04_023192 [Brassica rapa subsp. trilocularis]|uniref:Uncharacterized protein n=1 Tax=Brassica rapa subsp. trilocularis TaxID=1813537 RepID=A0ABQ7M335_BRACM|nr:hypothetical protein IGI04_023192 [Brassica rapa subsp. trilocularis]